MAEGRDNIDLNRVLLTTSVGGLRRILAWRKKVIVATKLMGYSKKSRIVANRTIPPAGKPYPSSRLGSANIRASVEGSFRGLQTDYISLYQTHWLDCYAPLFGRRVYIPENKRDSIDFKETLFGRKAMPYEGKICTMGISKYANWSIAQTNSACLEL